MPKELRRLLDGISSPGELKAELHAHPELGDALVMGGEDRTAKLALTSMLQRFINTYTWADSLRLVVECLTH